jgi:hypothetical protein
MRNRISFLKKLSVLWMMILLTVSSLPLWAYAAESQGVDVAVEVQTLRKGDTPEEEK